ncbi:endonuclease domain-containing 1 protein-like [Centroberyx gerrardi]
MNVTLLTAIILPLALVQGRQGVVNRSHGNNMTSDLVTPHYNHQPCARSSFNNKYNKFAHNHFLFTPCSDPAVCSASADLCGVGATSPREVSLFTNCQQFFLNGNHPTILTDSSNNNRYQQICQCLLDQNKKPQYFYATLYDTVNKIPVYSAYEFQHAGVTRVDKWYIEPQRLQGADWQQRGCAQYAEPNFDLPTGCPAVTLWHYQYMCTVWKVFFKELDGVNIPCMDLSTSVPAPQRGQHQALNKDYEGSGYDKGHLYSVFHTATQSAMLATSTLTNAAPQDSGFNRGKWKSHEMDLVNILQGCTQAYVVTGVIPGNQQIGGGVRVAQFYWNAYCCLDPNGNRSNGFIGPDQNGRVENLQSVGALETRLQGHYNPTFTVFPGGC